MNTSPSHEPHRYVIHFKDYPLRREPLSTSWFDATEEARTKKHREGIVPLDYPGPVAADWPDLLSIVEYKVKPERLESSLRSKSSHGDRAAIWWQLYHQAKDLYVSIEDLERVLVISQTSRTLAFAFLPTNMVYSSKLILFPFSQFAAFSVLQCRVHEIWVRFFGSTMKDDAVYTPSDCFETFPFPSNWEFRSEFESAGKEYYEFRAALMVRNDEGMTKTYNRFHDPYENSVDIAELRRLHAAMDRAVLNVYGWADIPTDCEFMLDYEIDEETWGNKKKPYRYRWPDPVHDEVLARLLELNAERAAEEARAGLTKPKAKTGQRSRKGSQRASANAGPPSATLWDAAR